MRPAVPSVLAAALATGLLALPAAASAAPTAGNNDFSTGPSCAVSCITEALVEPHTGAFAVDVRTDTPASIFFGVQHINAPPSMWVGTTQSPPGRTQFSGHVSGLEPDTLYRIRVTAVDAQQRVETRTTYMRTRAVQTAQPQTVGDVQSHVGCSEDCISHVHMAPDATGAGMTVDTTVPAKLHVSVDDNAPGTIGGTPIFGTPEDTFSVDAYATRQAGFVDRLQPGRTYHMIIRATDANGNFSIKQGLFHTKERRAKLVLDGIRIYYDGDKGANRGELRFNTAINQEIEGDFRIKEKKRASGNWVDFPGDDTVHLMPQSRGLNIAVQARERDHHSSCFEGDTTDTIWSPDSGRIDEWCEKWTWVTVRKVIDLDAPLPGASPIAGGAGRHEFQMLTSNTAGIRFVVYGYVDVKYS